MNKYERHSYILQVIKDNVIQTQEELAKRLTEHGIIATQATISRDIKELRLIKVLSDNDIYKYATSSSESIGNMESRLSNVFAESVISVKNARNIVVLKTLSGMAQAAASAIDAMEYKEILGCIAGDDTIMVVTSEDKDAAKISARLKLMIK